MKEFATATKVDLLLGIIDQEEDAAYNAALLVTEGGAREQRYRKVHLVPFGEYVPGRHTIPGIARIVGDQVPEDFGFGKEHAVFTMTDKEVRLAPLICFEDTIGELTRQFVLDGANLLANVTNDGWFLQSSGSQQHLANAVFRCVETRLPMVRSANTGVTCFINEFGRVTQKLVGAGRTAVDGRCADGCGARADRAAPHILCRERRVVRQSLRGRDALFLLPFLIHQLAAATQASRCRRADARF